MKKIILMLALTTTFVFSQENVCTNKCSVKMDGVQMKQQQGCQKRGNGPMNSNGKGFQKGKKANQQKGMCPNK